MKVAEFARMAGVSRQAIYRAVRSGRLPALVNGQLDADHPDTAWFLEVHGVQPDEPQGTPEEMPSRADAELRRTEAQAAHWELRNQRDRGSLIDRELVAAAIEITDSEHQRLLADGAETIARVAHDLVKTGATREDIAVAVRSEIFGALKAWKSQISRTLKFFYDTPAEKNG